MKYLRFVLVSVYVVLIILLIITRCSGQAAEKAIDIGGKGNLKITLLWDFPADLDLHVLEPSGFEICFENMLNPETGGFMDLDNRNGGAGAAENIFWENPPKGEYVIAVDYYEAVGGIPEIGNCQIVVFKEDEKPVTYNIEITEVKQMVIVAKIEM